MFANNFLHAWSIIMYYTLLKRYYQGLSNDVYHLYIDEIQKTLWTIESENIADFKAKIQFLTLSCNFNLLCISFETVYNYVSYTVRKDTQCTFRMHTNDNNSNKKHAHYDVITYKIQIFSNLFRFCSQIMFYMHGL